jgi:hypothetical protein
MGAKIRPYPPGRFGAGREAAYEAAFAFLLVAYRSGSAETHFFTAGCPSFTDYNGNPADKVSESFRTRARFAFLFPLDGVMKAVGCLPFAMGQHYNASRPDQGDRL